MQTLLGMLSIPYMMGPIVHDQPLSRTLFRILPLFITMTNTGYGRDFLAIQRIFRLAKHRPYIKLRDIVEYLYDRRYGSSVRAPL